MTRVLPPPDVFASCPLEGRILEHYAGTFDAVFISLNPFIKPISIHKEEFKPGTYPSRSRLVKGCEAVRWSEVAQMTGVSVEAIDIGLRTRINGLRKDLENQEFATKINTLTEQNGILPPEEGRFPELLHDDILRAIQTLGYEWLWVGDEFDTERKLHWIEDLKSPDDGLTLGRFNIFTPDKRLLWTTQWDSHFSFLCSSKEMLDAIQASANLEGFFCGSTTEVYWSVQTEGESDKAKGPV